MVQDQATGLDLGHVEDVVDQLQQIVAALVDVLGVLAVFRAADRAEGALAHDLGEAENGVERRAQLVGHVGQEGGLGAGGRLGALLLGGVVLVHLGQLDRLALGVAPGDRQIVDDRHQPALGIRQTGLMQLELGDVGADGDEAVVGGAALRQEQPAAVRQQRLGGALAAGEGRAGHGMAVDRLAGLGHDGGQRRAARHVRLGQAEGLAIFGIAQDQAILAVAQDEGLGDVLDGVVELGVGLVGAARQLLLLGHVDGHADQMDLVLGGARDLGAGPQPDIAAVAVAHAEDAVEAGDLAGGDLPGDLEQAAVVGMHQRRDVAEGQDAVPGAQVEYFVHGARPVHPAARNIPVPEPAMAPRQGGIDPLMGFQIQRVGVLGPRRLAEIGIEHDQHDRGGQREERDVDRDRMAPFGQKVGLALDEGEDALIVGKAGAGDQCRLAAEAGVLHAGALAEHQEFLVLADQALEIAADEILEAGHGRDDHAVTVADHGEAAVAQEFGGQGAGEKIRRQGDTVAIGLDGVALGAHQRGGDGQVADGALFQSHPLLDEGRQADDRRERQEGDDEDGDRAAKRLLGAQKLSVGRGRQHLGVSSNFRSRSQQGLESGQ